MEINASVERMYMDTIQILPTRLRPFQIQNGEGTDFRLKYLLLITDEMLSTIFDDILHFSHLDIIKSSIYNK